jgi:hypothetical protein
MLSRFKWMSLLVVTLLLVSQTSIVSAGSKTGKSPARKIANAPSKCAFSDNDIYFHLPLRPKEKYLRTFPGGKILVTHSDADEKVKIMLEKDQKTCHVDMELIGRVHLSPATGAFMTEGATGSTSIVTIYNSKCELIQAINYYTPQILVSGSDIGFAGGCDEADDGGVKCEPSAVYHLDDTCVPTKI